MNEILKRYNIYGEKLPSGLHARIAPSENLTGEWMKSADVIRVREYDRASAQKVYDQDNMKQQQLDIANGIIGALRKENEGLLARLYSTQEQT